MTDNTNSVEQELMEAILNYGNAEYDYGERQTDYALGKCAEHKEKLIEAIASAIQAERERIKAKVIEIQAEYEKKCDTWPELAPPATDALDDVLELIREAKGDE
jgi:hypothetical protein